MDAPMLALILAAGRGSRFEGLPDGVNKCALPIQGKSPVLHTIQNFLSTGVRHFTIIVGYAGESVKNALRSVCGEADVRFVYNPYFAFHGCNYSLACAVASGALEGVKRLVVAEGDSLLSRRNIQQLMTAGNQNAVFLRDASFINPARSVIAVGSDGAVHRFVYDNSHGNVLTTAVLDPNESIFGESMQLWSFNEGGVERLTEKLRTFAEEAEKEGRPRLENGVYSINEAAVPMAAVHSLASDEWINLNTRADLDDAEKCQWLAT